MSATHEVTNQVPPLSGHDPIAGHLGEPDAEVAHELAGEVAGLVAGQV